jgi:PKHD-type hydroxylase
MRFFQMETLFQNTSLLGRMSYEKVFTSDECEKILSLTGDTNTGYLDNKVIDKEIRNTRVKQINLKENEWIGKRLLNIILKANDLYYKFHISRINEIHVLEYGKDCFYDWHIDIGATPKTCTRKISAVLFLNERTEYEGGELEWMLGPVEDDFKPGQKKGSIVLFPSFIMHRVKPVGKGVRKVLVAWAHGDSFS